MSRTTVLIAFFFIASGVGTLHSNDTALEKLSLPEIDWAMQLDLQEFETRELQFLPDLSGRAIKVTNPENGLIATIHISTSKKSYDVKQFRDQEWDSLRNSGLLEFEDVKKYEKKEVAYVEYFIREFEVATGLKMKNVHSYIVQDDKYITIHLSKVDFKPEDQKLFDHFFKTTKLIQDYKQTSYDYFLYGSHFFRNRDYEKSAYYYQLALNLEKEHQLLPEKLWLVLIDNLAMAYGIPGRVDNAIQVLEYGISLKPEYPLFYYNLACAYAELEDLEQVLTNLSRAYGYRRNMIRGELFPNPADDPSFTRFLKNKRFKELLEGW